MDTSRPSSSLYITSSSDIITKPRLSPIHTKNQITSVSVNLVPNGRDGRQNSDKMLDSRKKALMPSGIRAPADGSSRQNSFCLPNCEDDVAEKNAGDTEINQHARQMEQMMLQCKELETSNRLEVVRSQRLDEHVNVLCRKIKFLQGEIEKTKGMLRKERVKTARLEKSLEKAQVDINTILSPYHSSCGKNCYRWLINITLKLQSHLLVFIFKLCYLGSIENDTERKDHTPVKNCIRNTPQKKQMERQSSMKHLTEKGPTIYIV